MSGSQSFGSILKEAAAGDQSSAPARSTSKTAGNTAANDGHITRNDKNNADGQGAVPKSLQPATSVPLRNSGQAFTMAPQSAVNRQDTDYSTHPLVPQPTRDSGEAFAMSTASTNNGHDAAREFAKQTSQAPPRNPVQLFTRSPATADSAAPNPHLSCSTTEGADQTTLAPPRNLGQSFSMQINRDPSFGLPSTPGSQIESLQRPQQQPTVISFSDEMDGVEQTPPQCPLQYPPQQPALVFVQQAVQAEDVVMHDAPGSASSTHHHGCSKTLRPPNPLRRAIPRIQQARGTARGAITKAKHVTATIHRKVKAIFHLRPESEDQALAAKLWHSFTRVDVPNECAEGVFGLVERKPDIEAFNATSAPFVAAVQQIDPTLSMGWTVNSINNALKPVYAAATDLRFRQRRGEEDMFGWSAETVRMFEEVVGYLGGLGVQKNESVRKLLGEAKYAAKQVFALLFTRVGEIGKTPW